MQRYYLGCVQALLERRDVNNHFIHISVAKFNLHGLINIEISILVLEIKVALIYS